MVKDSAEQPDEEIHRTRSGWVGSAGASVPYSWGVPLSWHIDMSPIQRLSEPETALVCSLGFITEARLIKLTAHNFWPPLPSPEVKPFKKETPMPWGSSIELVTHCWVTKFGKVT